MRNFVLNKKESALLRKGETITKTRGNYVYTVTPSIDSEQPKLSISLKEGTRVVIRDSKTITLHFDVVAKAKRGEQATQSVDGETLVLTIDGEGKQNLGIVNDYQVITQ